MNARIGKWQLEWLILLGSPTRIALTRDRASDALVRRGFLRPYDEGTATCITPAGLRALADAMERGEVDDALERMRKDTEARQAKIKARHLKAAE